MLQGFHGVARLSHININTIASFFKLINCASPSHKTNHLLSERWRMPDREPTALKTSGMTALASKFLLLHKMPTTSQRGLVSSQKCSVLYSFYCLVFGSQLSTKRSLTVCVYDTVSIFKKADGTEKDVVCNVDLD